MAYKVKRSSNAGSEDEILNFPTEEAANQMIEDELNEVKAMLVAWCKDYDYGEFFYEDGLTTEIWVSGEDFYTSWTRLWERRERGVD